MTENVNDAPAPDSEEFLQESNTVDKQTDPGTSADDVSTDPEALPADQNEGSGQS